MASSRRRFLMHAAAMGGAAFAHPGQAWAAAGKAASVPARRRARDVLSPGAPGPAGGPLPPSRGRNSSPSRAAGVHRGAVERRDGLRGHVPRPAQLGPLGPGRPGRGSQPHHPREARGRGRTRADRADRVAEPRLRAAAALHPEELARPRRRLRHGLPRLHLPRVHRDARRRAVPHLGRRRDLAGTRSGRRDHHAGRAVRRHHALERRHHHQGRADRRPAPPGHAAREHRRARAGFRDRGDRPRPGGPPSSRATRCWSTAAGAPTWRAATTAAAGVRGCTRAARSSSATTTWPCSAGT